jgi:hypothetical protein
VGECLSSPVYILFFEKPFLFSFQIYIFFKKNEIFLISFT